jgi:pimeloyl-ACP methyl ester carboxylesterase
MNRTAHFENTAISYDETGKGKPLVFLHGYLEAKEVWQPLTNILSGEFRIITIDIPGHGASGIAGEVHTMELIAEAVSEVMKDAGINRVLMTGHSLGGYAALAFAEKYPEKLSGYVLFHSHPHADTPEAIEKRRREISLVRAGKKDLMYPGNVSMMFAEQNLMKMTGAVRRFQDIASKNPGDGIIALLKGMMARPSRKNVVEGGMVPLLWILGRYDRYFSPQKVLDNIKLPQNSAVEILEDSGHLGFIEETEKSARLIAGFARRITW